jgi:diamine N-acetyltransferase
MASAACRPAVPEDLPRLLSLQQAYYAGERYRFLEPLARKVWHALLSDPGLGSTWVVEAGSGLVGYVVLTLGWSLEYGGRDAAIDELYIVPEWRGQGLARDALRVVEAACAERGVKALHLEVERDNQGAQILYRRHGFEDGGRVLMTKLLRRSAGDGAL